MSRARALVALPLVCSAMACSIGALPPRVGADATTTGALAVDGEPAPRMDGPGAGGTVDTGVGRGDAGGNDAGQGNGGAGGADLGPARSDGTDAPSANGGAGSGGIADAGGGTTGKGGTTSTGTVTSSGGVVSSGGTLGGGGIPGSGSVTDSGTTGNGGTTGTGTVTSSGGGTRAGGTLGSGGVPGSGCTGNGGAGSTGGVTGSGGLSGGAGGSGSGGATGTGGVSTDGGTETVNCSATMPSGGNTYTGTSVNGTADGLNYGIWSNGNAGSITVFPTAHAFAASWSNSGDFLAHLGLDFNASKSYTAYGTIAGQFVETKTGSAGGFSSIGMYGWMHSPCIEWYINEDSFNGLAPRGSVTATIDGATYYLTTSTTTGTGGSSCEAGHTGSWTNITSTRKTARQCGTITVSDHFAAWVAQGWNLGTLASVHINVEVGGGTGSIQFPVANVTTTSN